MQNLEVSDEIEETLSTETPVLTIQTLRPNITTTDSECVVPLQSQRKLNEANPQNQNEHLEVGDSSPKLSKITTTKCTDTKEDELEQNPCSIAQQPGNEKMTRERAVPSRKSCLEEEQHFIRPQKDEEKSVVEMLTDENAKLKTIQNDQKFEACSDNPILQERSLRHSPRRKLRIDSRLSKDSQELVTDVKEFISVPTITEISEIEAEFMQEKNVNTKPGEATQNRTLNDCNKTTQGVSKKETLNLMASWKKSGERLSEDRNNSKKHETPGTAKSENQVVKEKQNIQSITAQTEREVTLKYGLENSKIAAESLSENVRIRESKKLSMVLNNEQRASNTRKRKLAEEGASHTDDKWEDANQTTVFSQNSKMSESYRKEPLVYYNS